MRTARSIGSSRITTRFDGRAVLGGGCGHPCRRHYDAPYPEDFDEAIAYLSKMLARRAKENPAQSLDIVCNTNYNHYMNHIRETFLKDLGSDGARKWFEDQVYLSDSIIRRSTIADDNAATNLRTMCCATLLIQRRFTTI